MTDNNSASTSTQDTSKLVKSAKSWLPFIAIIAVVYFGYVEIQTYLGKQALEETGLSIHTLHDALDTAKKEDKLVLADMSAIWCPTCRKLDKEVFTDDNVKQAINDKYIFARIEYESEEGEAFMKKYGVRGFPTLLIINQEGEKVRKLPLTFNPQNFISLL